MINEIHELESGQVIHTHPLSVNCLARACTIHNPSDHPLRGAPRLWHPDKGIMMRVCLHGNAHLDADEIRQEYVCHCDCYCCGQLELLRAV